MKKYTYWLLALCGLFFTLLTSCSKDRNYFEGKWETVQLYPYYDVNLGTVMATIDLTFYDCLQDEYGGMVYELKLKDMGGTSINGVYYNDGTKQTTVEIMVNGQRLTADCSVDGRTLTMNDDGRIFKFKKK